ncbi:hypothetical protein [Nocardia iowensis]|uniref:Uncharacterized protein n=1 Tax=Nocardia iowensis TaxID=204891 RepID=A0ABX8RGS4_NOCIO|nr:hypothetical protein [Nocardia iowensis]QXN88803.1 hypothetical protein KV110_24830 [Nocardia iowensis]
MGDLGILCGMEVERRLSCRSRGEPFEIESDRGLVLALEALDGAFGSIRPPAAIDCCPHCEKAHDYAPLLTRPRQQLTGTELGAYAFSVLNTVGSAADLHYLTGRILQLLHSDDSRMPDIEVFYDKLHRAGWTSWPQAEAIGAVFDALWHDLLTRDSSHESVETLLCALGLAEDTIAPRLSRWADLDCDIAVRRLYEFVTWGCRQKDGLLLPCNTFWNRALPTYRELVVWLNEGPALCAVTAAFDRYDDPHLLEVVAGIHGLLVMSGHEHDHIA